MRCVIFPCTVQWNILILRLRVLKPSFKHSPAWILSDQFTLPDSPSRCLSLVLCRFWQYRVWFTTKLISTKQLQSRNSSIIFVVSMLLYPSTTTASLLPTFSLHYLVLILFSALRVQLWVNRVIKCTRTTSRTWWKRGRYSHCQWTHSLTLLFTFVLF